MTTPGRPLPNSTERARKLRRQSTIPERLLWSRLRRGAIGAKFRRQQPLGPYIVDFYCPTYGLVVEVIGRSHIGRGAQDAARLQWLESQGFRVLLVSNDDIASDPDEVANRIARLLRDTQPPPPLPNPLPRGERE